MSKKWKVAVTLAITSLLVACGGGSSPTPRGAIAINQSSGYGVITTFHTSQPKANSAAINDCGSSACVVVLEFSGDGQCGSIAWGRNAIWGVGTSGSKEQADKRAIEQCAERGGSTCVIPSWVNGQCN